MRAAHIIISNHIASAVDISLSLQANKMYAIFFPVRPTLLLHPLAFLRATRCP